MIPQPFFFYMASILLCVMPLQARWATTADAPAAINQTTTINVEKNGHIKSTDVQVIKILTEKGREMFAEIIRLYDDDTEKMRMSVTIKTKDGKDAKIYKIEDKGTSSGEFQFSNMRQITCALPSLTVGSVITVTTEYTQFKSDLDHYYANLFSPPALLINSCHINITSEIPLYTQFNNVDNAWKLSDTKKKDTQIITLQNTKPVVRFAVNDSKISLEKFPYLLVCSEKSMVRLKQKVTPLFEKALKSPLPEKFVHMAQNAQKQPTEVDQINTVTQSLINTMQYLTINKLGERLKPHTLSRIAKYGRGDCKDFSTCTVAILRHMGYKAYVAIITRGVFARDIETPLGYQKFNHAMVKVIGKKGKVYWIDPTNYVSMANGIFPDIQDRDVLVLDNENTGLEKTSPIDPNHASTTINQTATINDKDGTLIQKGTMIMRGESTIPMTYLPLYPSQKQKEDAIYSFLTNHYVDPKDRISLTLPDNNDRIVKDVSIDFHFVNQHALITSNVGWALKLPSLSPISKPASDMVGNAFLDNPQHQVTTVFLPDIVITNPERLNVLIDSPWIKVQRVVEQKKNGTLITSMRTIKKSWIKNEELMGTQWSSIQKELDKKSTCIAVLSALPAGLHTIAAKKTAA